MDASQTWISKDDKLLQPIGVQKPYAAVEEAGACYFPPLRIALVSTPPFTHCIMFLLCALMCA